MLVDLGFSHLDSRVNSERSYRRKCLGVCGSDTPRRHLREIWRFLIFGGVSGLCGDVFEGYHMNIIGTLNSSIFTHEIIEVIEILSFSGIKSVPIVQSTLTKRVSGGSVYPKEEN